MYGYGNKSYIKKVSEMIDNKNYKSNIKTYFNKNITYNKFKKDNTISLEYNYNGSKTRAKGKPTYPKPISAIFFSLLISSLYTLQYFI